MLLDPTRPVMVQGITGREATMMVADMQAHGSSIVAGVTPGKGGLRVHGVPVYDTVDQAVQEHRPPISIVSVPAAAALDAALEAIAHRVRLCVVMTERVPILDACKIIQAAKKTGCTVIGPNSLGLIRPGVGKLGTIGGRIDNVRRSFTPGRVAILSRSGGMTTEISSFLTEHGIGQSIAVGVGGDRIVGSNFTELVISLEKDNQTDAIVIFGEPGGTAEEQLADHLKQNGMRKRIVALLAGQFVDELEGVRFGHAAVMVQGGRGSTQAKAAALKGAGVTVAESFEDIVTGVQA